MKCIIVDLDQTLWGGVLSEDGPQLTPAHLAFQRALLDLKQRGMLLAIASKNNDDDEILRVFQLPEMVLRLDDFVSTQIHWHPKSLSIARLAPVLNLSTRDMVFIDDNPAECAEVKMAHPDITVIQLPPSPSMYVHALLADGLFDDIALTTEDTNRTALYKQREQAESLRVKTPSQEEFLRSLDMTVILENVTAANVARAAQLTQKTNQFNATTERYDETQFRHDIMLAVRLTDKFGDNGMVGLLLADCVTDLCLIGSFLLSCRVINRTLETAMLWWLVERAKRDEYTGIKGWIRPTARNLPVRDLYERHGFSRDGSGWRLDVTSSTITLPPWFRVEDRTI